jgi:hypothetical protein
MRDLDADIKDYEPDNKFLSISSFKLRMVNDSYLDNIILREKEKTVVVPKEDVNYSIEDAQDTLIDGWSFASTASVENIYNDFKKSRVIHLHSDTYQYYAMRGLNNRDFKKIRWNMKISDSFFVYIDVTTSAGSRLLYYNATNNNRGLSGSGIHHGLGVASKNGEWQTFTRNLEQDIKDYEPTNKLISIDSFKIRAINDVLLDNVELFGNRIVNLDSTGNSATQTNVIPISNPNENQNLYSEGFEGTNRNGYLLYKSSTNSHFNLGHSNFLFDKNDYTEGNQSLKVEIDIPGLGDNRLWYYYLKIPMNPVFDLEGNLSLSMDVKLSNGALGKVQIGLELPYYPTSSGLKRISSLKKAGVWEQIKMDNIPQETFKDANKWLNRYLYDGDLTDIGRAVTSIVLLIKGKGPLSCSVHLDNIKIGGTQLYPNDFKNLYTTRWNNYRTRIKDKIRERTEQRDALPALPDISSLTLCSVERERYDYAQTTLTRINVILNEMNSRIVNSYFEPYLMKELDGLLQSYKGIVALLEESFNNRNQKIKVLNMPSMKYYRLT